MTTAIIPRRESFHLHTTKHTDQTPNHHTKDQDTEDKPLNCITDYYLCSDSDLTFRGTQNY